MTTRERVIIGLGIALLYVALASSVFRFRHPWMTETELLLHTVDALLWERVEKP